MRGNGEWKGGGATDILTFNPTTSCNLPKVKNITCLFKLSPPFNVVATCFLYSLGTPGGVLRLGNDRDDRRIFLGLKFSIPGFFWVAKFGKYFFWVT